MDVLVPVDGSDCSMRALRFGIEFARRFEGTLHVVHFTEVQGEDTAELKAAVDEILESEGIDTDTEIVGDVRLGSVGSSKHVGEDVLDVVEARGYDHVVMGHHGAGRVEELVLGSAAKTVTKAGQVPLTIVP